jgi:hypothetical protein
MWLRVAYHDMSTHNVTDGTGGLDASIVFETARAENPGNAFVITIGDLAGATSTRNSFADSIAIAAIVAAGITSNGSIIVPFWGGRVDAEEAGPSGVPEPQQDLATHTAKFASQGFNVSEMITLVACGHSIGGVHGVDFPTIVPVPANASTVSRACPQHRDLPFDANCMLPASQKEISSRRTLTMTRGYSITMCEHSSVALQRLPDVISSRLTHRRASQFVANITQNPLAFGANVTTRSDARIFNADGGDMIARMAADNDFYQATCTVFLERMLNTVPSSVTLFNVSVPYVVKPVQLYATVNANGTMTVSGTIRVSFVQSSSSGNPNDPGDTF